MGLLFPPWSIVHYLLHVVFGINKSWSRWWNDNSFDQRTDRLQIDKMHYPSCKWHTCAAIGVHLVNRIVWHALQEQVKYGSCVLFSILTKNMQRVLTSERQTHWLAISKETISCPSLFLQISNPTLYVIFKFLKYHVTASEVVLESGQWLESDFRLIFCGLGLSQLRLWLEASGLKFVSRTVTISRQNKQLYWHSYI